MATVVGMAHDLAYAEEADDPLDSLLKKTSVLLPEEHRTSIRKIVVLPGVLPSSGAVTGSYQKKTDGLIGGIDKGGEIGIFRKEVGGIPIGFPIPVLRQLGQLFGGVSGTIKRQTQEFRDSLTKDLAESTSSPLSNDALATDVFWRLRDVPGIEPKVFALTTPIPEDTDAILYVSFSDSSIFAEGNKATLVFSATAVLQRVSDGEHLYENVIHYRDTDTLTNWTKNDKAAWQNYANYARHYVGREIVAELFERVDVRQSLQPLPTDTVKNVKQEVWQSVTRSTRPTLAWQLQLDDGDEQLPWAKSANITEVSYELEIYDLQQLVYAQKGISTPSHTIANELQDCQTYRWTVRPAYRVGSAVRYGQWMRSGVSPANGNNGSASAIAAAYIHDFAKLEVKCGRR